MCIYFRLGPAYKRRHCAWTSFIGIPRWEAIVRLYLQWFNPQKYKISKISAKLSRTRLRQERTHGLFWSVWSSMQSIDDGKFNSDWTQVSTFYRRTIKRRPVWIRAFPWKPLYKQDQGHRMGKGLEIVMRECVLWSRVIFEFYFFGRSDGWSHCTKRILVDCVSSWNSYETCSCEPCPSCRSQSKCRLGYVTHTTVPPHLGLLNRWHCWIHKEGTTIQWMDATRFDSSRD